MDTVVKELKRRIKGAVLHEPSDTARYARDQSIYKIVPRCVVIPESVEDIVETVLVSADAGVPITPRGGGSGTAGAGLGSGIVVAIDRKCPMNRVLSFDATGSRAEIEVEAGIVHDDVQKILRAERFYLPADPSSGAMCQIGGNIATKASGPHALRHGSIDRYLKHLCLVTDRGEVVDTARESTIPERIASGIADLKRSLSADAATVELLKKRAGRKIASGYNLFAMLSDMPPGELLAQLLVGGVGTLGIVTRATLQAEPYIENRATMAISFESLSEAGEAVSRIRMQGVAAIEIVSANTVKLVRERRAKAFEALPSEGNLLLVEYEGDEMLTQIDAVKRIVETGRFKLIAAPLVATDEASQARIWKDRKQLLPAIIDFKPELKALSVVNDVGIDEQHLAAFISQIEAVFERHGLQGAIYGHAGSGNLHLRPLFDTQRPDLKSAIQRLADDVYRVVLDLDGTITAEHGMGRLRAPYLESEWGEAAVSHMRRLKEIFDPRGLLNPNAMFSSNPITDHMYV